MELFSWKPEYSVQNSTIDNQHRGLINIINELFTAMRTGQTEEKNMVILKKLQQYTVNHFTSEETLMKKHRYPDLAKHQLSHKTFVDQINKFIADLESGNKTVSIELLKTLKEWLQNHILNIDRQYVPYITQP